MCQVARLTTSIVLLMCAAGPAAARQADVQWIAGSGGSLPPTAAPYGREANGQPQFVCRGQVAGAMELGRISSGMSGCSIGFERRELVLATYEVMARPAPPVAAVATVTPLSPSMAEHVKLAHAATARAAIEEGRMQLPQPPKLPAAIPPTPADSSSRRGFDEHGQPYIEVTLPDGTIKRTQRNGVTLITPDGASQFIPNQYAYANAQPPTPPALPDDPSQGMLWVSRHNDALFYLISDLVQHDENEMKKFSDGEREAAGDDAFAQIVYRTTIADFLATSR
jgi:hypothetical protein